MDMRHYILRVLLVFVCLFVLFSHSLTVCAADNTYTFLGVEYSFTPFNPEISTYALVDGFNYSYYYIDLNGDQVNFTDSSLDLTDPEVYRNGIEDGRILLVYILSLPDLLAKNSLYDMDIRFSHSSGNLEFSWLNCVNKNYASLTETYTYSETYSTLTDSRFTISDISASNGTTKFIYLYLWYTPEADITSLDTSIGLVNITEVSSNGLLASIIEFLKSIWDGIKNLPTNIANSIKGFFDNIVNAVVNLGNTILDGIKSLFIPSEEDITNMKDKWDTLLSDRFGALYQVTSLISDYASSFKEQSKNTITFPSISIPLAGATFEFGGWEVQVVPDGFGIIFDTLKMITSILATMLFINGLKNRFDKIMGGADDI